MTVRKKTPASQESIDVRCNTASKQNSVCTPSGATRGIRPDGTHGQGGRPVGKRTAAHKMEISSSCAPPRVGR